MKKKLEVKGFIKNIKQYVYDVFMGGLKRAEINSKHVKLDCHKK